MVSDSESRADRLKRRLSGLVAGKDEQEAAEAERDARLVEGAQRIGACANGSRALLCGTLKSVTLLPRSGTLALEADLYDGSGHMRLVWLGRRRIEGIEPGRRITAAGRITCVDDQPVIFNPRYELLPRDDA